VREYHIPIWDMTRLTLNSDKTSSLYLRSLISASSCSTTASGLSGMDGLGIFVFHVHSAKVIGLVMGLFSLNL